ncbi:MAG: diguanylate cyclase domain-containing protein [Thainema sp.]
MHQRPAPSKFASIGQKLPLRAVLIIPFVMQLVGTVGLVGYLSFRAGQKAVDELVKELQREVATHIQQEIKAYTTIPHAVNQINATTLLRGEIDLVAVKGEQFFGQQIRSFPTLNYTYCSTEADGAFLGAGRSQPTAAADSFETSFSNAATGYRFQYYSVDRYGYRDQLQGTHAESYDPRVRPWYEAAKTKQAAAWSPIYLDWELDLPTITASLPVYDAAGQFIGVCGTDIILTRELNQFLRSLKVGQTGATFIIERNGQFVASSTTDSLLITDGQPAERQVAPDSRHPLIRSSSQFLNEQFGDFSQITSFQQLSYQTNGQRYFVSVMPYQDAAGLDWLIIVTLPEQDFIEQIQSNTNRTIALCGAALILSILLGLLIVRWVLRPLVTLRDAAQNIAEGGDWDQTVTTHHAGEIGELTTAFNAMTQRLRHSLLALKRLNQTVTSNEQRLNQFLEAIPIGIMIHSCDGELVYMNQQARHLLDIDEMPKAKITDCARALKLYKAETQQFYPVDELPVAQALAGKQVYIDDIQVHHSSGTIVPLEVTATPVRDDNHQIAYAIAAFQNIAQRRQTEQVLANYNQQLEQKIAERTRALQESEATKAAILEAIPDLLIRQDRQGYQLDVVEGDDIQTVGTLDELINHPVTDSLPPHLVEKRLHYTRLALDTGQRQIYEYEIEIQGELRHEEARIVPCGPDEVLIIIRDITSRKQIEAALQRSEAQNRAILTAIPDLMFQANTAGVYTNYVRTDALADLISASDLPIGQKMQDYLSPEMAEHQMQALKQAIATQQPVIYEQQVVVDGAVQFEEVRVVASGTDEALFIIRDVTDRKRAELELEAQQQFIRQVLDMIPSSVFVKDAEGRLIMANQACSKIHGLPTEAMLGKREDEFNPNLSKAEIDQWVEYNRQVMKTGQPHQHLNQISASQNEAVRYYQTIISPLTDINGQAQGVVGNSVDITDLKQLEEELRQINLELERLATLDGLTHVPNRRRFDDYLAAEWLRSQREQHPLSLIMFDVDYFKLFNDFYGHQKGDDCLIGVAQTAQLGIRRPADLLARYGGEEFAVVLPNTDINGAIAVAQQIQQRVRDLQFAHEKSLISDRVTISLGVACLIPQRHQSPKTLIELADQALYQAKDQGRDRYCVSPSSQ